MVECTLFVTQCLRVNLQLHTISLVRTCRISSFCTVAWQLARLLLTRRIARSLGDSRASCINSPSRCSASCNAGGLITVNLNKYLVFSVVNSAVNMTLPRLLLSAVLRRRCCRSPAAVARSPACPHGAHQLGYSKPVARRCAAAE